MSNITKSDLKSFAKVLIAIGNKVNSNPDELLSLINSFGVSDKKNHNFISSELELEIESFDFFEKSTDGKFNEIEEYLNKYEYKELAYINKYLKFPYNRSKVKKTLINDIIDQLKKRTENVFRHHE
ncbi:hypothetical protein [Shewanella baltica]|uniref:hypothetical protein n=1 Tax=Shewanella baltica TaxID=62322 RepID=UPI00059D1867|nr:hypothetical protein [Shewanella baltica]